jgi:hypothetical protein
MCSRVVTGVRAESCTECSRDANASRKNFLCRPTCCWATNAIYEEAGNVRFDSVKVNVRRNGGRHVEYIFGDGHNKSIL